MIGFVLVVAVVVLLVAFKAREIASTVSPAPKFVVPTIDAIEPATFKPVVPTYVGPRDRWFIKSGYEVPVIVEEPKKVDPRAAYKEWIENNRRVVEMSKWKSTRPRPVVEDVVMEIDLDKNIIRNPDMFEKQKAV